MLAGSYYFRLFLIDIFCIKLPKIIILIVIIKQILSCVVLFLNYAVKMEPKLSQFLTAEEAIN